MGTLAWDLGPGSFGDRNEHLVQPARNPQLTIHCSYPNTSLPPSCVTFRLSPRYGFPRAREAHDWFLGMMVEHEDFEVATDEPGEEAVPFWSETIRQVVVVV